MPNAEGWPTGLISIYPPYARPDPHPEDQEALIGP
jgi:hypothetical protein